MAAHEVRLTSAEASCFATPLNSSGTAGAPAARRSPAALWPSGGSALDDRAGGAVRLLEAGAELLQPRHVALSGDFRQRTHMRPHHPRPSQAAALRPPLADPWPQPSPMSKSSGVPRPRGRRRGWRARPGSARRCGRRCGPRPRGTGCFIVVLMAALSLATSRNTSTPE